MANEFHKNLVLDDIHASTARTYDDITARDADTDFNTDSDNLFKDVIVLSPLTSYRLMTTAPIFSELTGVPPGNVTTSDTLLATQLLLGNGGQDIVTEPDLIYDGLTFEMLGAGGLEVNAVITVDPGGPSLTLSATNVDLGVGGSFSIENDDVIAWNGGSIALRNIAALDSVTRDTIEAALIDLPNLESVGTTSGSIIGPSGAWDNGGFNIGPGDMYSINSVIVIDSDPSITLKNIAALDATTEATILAISGIGNVTTSDTLTANRLLTGNGGSDIVIEPLLFWDGTLLGVGTAAPDTTVDIDGNGLDALRLRSGNTSGFTRNQIRLSHDDSVDFTHVIKTRHNEFSQSGNAIDIFMWDSDDQDPDDLGDFHVLTILGNGKIGIGKTAPSGFVDILTTFGDTTPVIQMESGANAGIVKLRTGNRNPNAAVTGAGPDVYYADRGALSGTYENHAATTDQVWLKRSVLTPTVIEIHNSAELDALASGGVITVASDLTLRIMAIITTANRFVINQGVFFIISGEYIADSILTYSGTDTFITSAGNSQIRANANIIASSTGILFNCTASSVTNIEQSQLVNWDDLGVVNDARAFFLTLVTLQNIGTGITFTNVEFLNINAGIQIGFGVGEPFFKINTNNPDSSTTINDMDSRNSAAGASLLDIDTRVHPQATVMVTNSVVAFGDLFRKSVLADATINSVADGSIATGTITAMADNGNFGTTISSTTTYFEDEEVTISGTTSYNGTFQIFNVVAGVSFDIITEFVADDATGSVDTERLTLSLAGGHGISTGDSIKVIDTNFYNGFATTLNVVSDDITINGSFISTNTGAIERDLSVDQTDPRISSRNNPGFVDSHFIACAHVNDNSDSVGAITNNVFTDLVFGTAADALIASSTMERWRLVNELNGTFEYIGSEPFDDAIQFDFTVESAGGTVDFRFKWMHDIGAGFVDLPDNVEALVAVGSEAQSVTKKFPLAANTGDLIKPQITRNSGSSGITVAYATVFAGG